VRQSPCCWGWPKTQHSAPDQRGAHRKQDQCYRAASQQKLICTRQRPLIKIKIVKAASLDKINGLIMLLQLASLFLAKIKVSELHLELKMKLKNRVKSQGLYTVYGSLSPIVQSLKTGRPDPMQSAYCAKNWPFVLARWSKRSIPCIRMIGTNNTVIILTTTKKLILQLLTSHWIYCRWWKGFCTALSRKLFVKMPRAWTRYHFRPRRNKICYF